jgi:malonate-semialdehyde dehydrogenase (acetylating)/methylmalonate-semialdehyde dehydrogenase
MIEAGLPPASSTSSTATRKRSTPSSTIPISRRFGFVGSSPIAQYIYERAAATGKRCAMLSAAPRTTPIVMPDADMDQTVDA